MEGKQLFGKGPPLFIKSITGKFPQAPLAPVSQQVHADMYSSLKPLIWLGRLTLVIPCSRDYANSYKRPSFSLKMIPCLATLLFFCLTCCLVISDFRLVLTKQSNDMQGITETVSNLYFLMETTMTSFMYLHCLRHSDKFFQIFELKTELARDVWLGAISYFGVIAGVLLSNASAVLIMTSAGYSFGKIAKAENISLPEAMYNFRMVGVKDAIPYHPVIYWALMGCKGLRDLAVMYVTLLILLFSRAMAFQFRKLVEGARRANLQYQDRKFWNDLVSKYGDLRQVVKAMDNFLSPLIFWLVTLNVYLISIQLYRGLVGMGMVNIPKEVFIVDFAIHTSQFLLAMISAATVDTSARDILEVVRSCPKEQYQEAEVYRLEQEVRGEKWLGFSGMGCFGLTRSFLLSVFSAIFTVEIVLLQSTQFKSL